MYAWYSSCKFSECGPWLRNARIDRNGCTSNPKTFPAVSNNSGFAFTSATVPNTVTGQSTYTRTGVAISDFLIGHPNAMSQDSPDDANENYWNYGFFLQVDWRMIPRLTVNLGVRYEVQKGRAPHPPPPPPTPH